MTKPKTQTPSVLTPHEMERHLSADTPNAIDLLLQKINDGLLDPGPGEDLPSSQLAQEIIVFIRGGPGVDGQAITPMEAGRLISAANARLRRIGFKKPSNAAYSSLPEGEEIPF